MSLRPITAGVLAAGLCLGIAMPAGACAPSPQPGGEGGGKGGASRDRMQTVTYPVADLVIPLNQPVRQEVKTQEQALMRLLVSTIAPQSWSPLGGAGVIDYFPLTMALVVTQTPAVHAQIQDLLASLRKLQDNEVSVEIKFVTVATEVMEQLGVQDKDGATPGMAVLDDTQVKMLLEGAQADRRTHVLQAPKITVFNGQQALLDMSEKQTFVVGVDFQDNNGKPMPQPKTKTVLTGMQVSVLPTISPDRRSVTMQLGINVGRADAPLALPHPTAWSKNALRKNEGPNEPRYCTLEVEKTLRLADGATALLTGWTQHREVRNHVCPPVISKIPYLGRIFATVSYGQETTHTLVLVTPRVVARPEEEQKPPMPTVEACAPTAPALETCEGLTRAVRHEVAPRPADVLHVNKESFELTYQLENVGPSQVQRVEVWWTNGDGKWARYPDDVRPGGPVPITVQRDGRYGFTLVPVSGAGRAGKRPEAGDEPKVWVEVDRHPPTLEIYNIDLSGLEHGKETIGLSWKAEDRNLRPDSVCLYWSESPEGPWHLIARDLKAVGSYQCPCKALPYRCYLRATAADLAGNVCEVTTPEPVRIDLRVPAIRDVKVNVRQ